MRSIKVGLSISLTGAYSVQGRESWEGISLWVSDVNKEDGIFVRELGRKLPVELVYLDDRSSADVCRANTEKLIAESKADILLGPYSSSLALASAEVAEEAGVTLWNHGGSTEEMEERGFTCLVNAITPTGRYAEGIIKLVRSRDPAARRIASFSALDSGFSRSVARGTLLSGQENGFEVREFQFASGSEDFSDILDEAIGFAPDLILGMGRAHDDLALARHVIDRKVKVNAAAFIAASIKLFADTFGRSAEGFTSSSQWEEGIGITPDAGPSPREFAGRFRRAYGKHPDYTAAQGYNIGLIVRKCIEDTGTLDDGALRKSARGEKLTTFYGRFGTDGNGFQTAHEMVVVQWQGGKKAIVSPEKYSEAGFIYPMHPAY
ncbi:MAG: ABC transporter substrate-binding protein [Candidatus Dadabacteria bacterium]|nr:MAG: ABC transporter substrate-binding protein [Candidatus Dadabacteria bacterium]